MMTVYTYDYNVSSMLIYYQSDIVQGCLVMKLLIFTFLCLTLAV